MTAEKRSASVCWAASARAVVLDPYRLNDPVMHTVRGSAGRCRGLRDADAANHTREAQMVQRLAAEHGWRRIVVVTWQYHLVRGLLDTSSPVRTDSGGTVDFVAVQRPYDMSVAAWHYLFFIRCSLARPRCRAAVREVGVHAGGGRCGRCHRSVGCGRGVALDGVGSAQLAPPSTTRVRPCRCRARATSIDGDLNVDIVAVQSDVARARQRHRRPRVPDDRAAAPRTSPPGWPRPAWRSR